MPDQPAIRPARARDQQQLGELWLGLMREHAVMDPRFGVADDALERWSNDFGAWLGDEHARIFVAEREEDLVGFIAACLWEPPPIYAVSEEVYVTEIYVAPEARGQGVGGRLLAVVKTWAEALPVERLRIGVLAANADGRMFWERQHARPFSLTLTIELEASTPAVKAEKKRARLGF